MFVVYSIKSTICPLLVVVFIIMFGNNLIITGKKKEINKLFPEYLNYKGWIHGDHNDYCSDKYFCSAALSKGIEFFTITDLLYKCL